MKYEHAITVRSQAGKNADYGRALERVAFFPGVTEANLIGADAGSVTIGYNGKECEAISREFCSDLEADGLVADGHLWDTRRLFGGRAASDAMALFCRRTWRGHFQGRAKPHAAASTQQADARSTAARDHRGSRTARANQSCAGLATCQRFRV
jgi:hypothetical protein